MTKFTHNDVLDAGLLLIKNNCTRQVALSQFAAVYADIATYKLADAAMVPGDFTIADNDEPQGGRKLVVAAQTGEAVDATGDPTHNALVDDTNQRILHITEEGGAVVLGAGGTTSFPSWAIRNRDPL